MLHGMLTLGRSISVFMTRLTIALGLTLAGCMPQEMTAEEELAHVRAEKAKHPERWQTLKKLTPSEATQQQRKWLKIEDEFRQQRIATLSKY